MLRYLSVDQVAEALSISRAAAYQLFRRADFPSIRLGHRLLIAESQLENWLESGATHGEPLSPTR